MSTWVALESNPEVIFFSFEENFPSQFINRITQKNKKIQVL